MNKFQNSPFHQKPRVRKHMNFKGGCGDFNTKFLSFTKKIGFSLFLALQFVFNVKAQDQITYKQAIEIALKKNFNIRIAENTAENEANNNSLGNAGFLPTLNLNARKATSSLNSDIELFDGTKINRDGAQTKTLNASLDLNWRLFDGTRMFMEYKRLGILSDIQKEALKSQINNTLGEVSLTYQQLLRLREAVDILTQGLSISRERLDLEQTKLTIGTGSELEVLQAQTDLNADSSAFMRQEIQYNSLKLQLVRLLSLDSKTDIELKDEEWKSKNFTIDAVLSIVKNQNPELKRLQLEALEQQIAVRQIQAEYSPELDFNLGYAFNDQEAEASQLRFLTTQGWNYNFTARLNLFQGLNQHRRIQNAKLTKKNNDLQLMQTELLLENQTRTIWLAYVQSNSIFTLETTNFGAAEKTLGISKEKYNQGLMSAVEFREAQRNWLNARLRLLNAEFDVRVNEIELMRLSGEFVMI